MLFGGSNIAVLSSHMTYIMEIEVYMCEELMYLCFFEAYQFHRYWYVVQRELYKCFRPLHRLVCESQDY